MGLLGGVLGLPLAPLRGAGWVLRQVAAEAERQVCDPEVVRRELAALEAELLGGRIGEAEFDRREDELLDRLAYGRAHGATGHETRETSP